MSNTRLILSVLSLSACFVHSAVAQPKSGSPAPYTGSYKAPASPTKKSYERKELLTEQSQMSLTLDDVEKDFSESRESFGTGRLNNTAAVFHFIGKRKLVRVQAMMDAHPARIAKVDAWSTEKVKAELTASYNEIRSKFLRLKQIEEAMENDLKRIYGAEAINKVNQEIATSDTGEMVDTSKLSQTVTQNLNTPAGGSGGTLPGGNGSGTSPSGSSGVTSGGSSTTAKPFPGDTSFPAFITSLMGDILANPNIPANLKDQAFRDWMMQWRKAVKDNDKAAMARLWNEFQNKFYPRFKPYLTPEQIASIEGGTPSRPKTESDQNAYLSGLLNGYSDLLNDPNLDPALRAKIEELIRQSLEAAQKGDPAAAQRYADEINRLLAQVSKAGSAPAVGGGNSYAIDRTGKFTSYSALKNVRRTYIGGEGKELLKEERVVVERGQPRVIKERNYAMEITMAEEPAEGGRKLRFELKDSNPEISGLLSGFIKSWTITSGGSTVASGNGPEITATAAQPGVYTVTITGNTDWEETVFEIASDFQVVF